MWAEAAWVDGRVEGVVAEGLEVGEAPVGLVRAVRSGAQEGLEKEWEQKCPWSRMHGEEAA